MKTQAQFHHPVWPYALLAPQLLVTVVFFIWPAAEAFIASLQSTDPFGIQTRWVYFDNFKTLLQSQDYLHTLNVTLVFSVLVTLLSLILGLICAYGVTQVVRGKAYYHSFFILPYAVAPAVAAILWRFLFNPAIGVLAYPLQQLGYDWNYVLQGNQALLLVVLAASWQQFSYNFIFFLAGLQAIPQSLLEAAVIDGANAWQRFWQIIFPLLSPTTFFLIIMNLLYALFETLGVIQIATDGGPAGHTQTLVYKVYQDGFVGLNIGSSSAQSVLLMLMMVVLTVLQFRYMERRIHY